MKTSTKFTRPALLSSLLLSTIFTTHAEVFYENNYDDGKMPDYVEDASNPSNYGQPVWALPPSFKRVYGTGNNFDLTNTTSHSGEYSLKVTYEARNGMCNACGTKIYTHMKSGHDNVNYFVDKDGTDLSIADNPATAKEDDGPKAMPGRVIYNLDGGYSKWKVVSVTDEVTTKDRINLELISAGLNGEKTIQSGDKIGITRQCGLDGIVGLINIDGKPKNDVRRRSDCNSLILWFTNVKPQPPGKSIFRRNYLKAEVTSPTIHQKFHYFSPGRNTTSNASIVLFGGSDEKTAPDIKALLSGLMKFGGAGIYRDGLGNGFDGLVFKRSVWYYVEEEYQAATLNPLFDPEYNPKSSTYSAAKYPEPNPEDPRYNEYSSDGAYRLWFSKAGEEPTTKSSPTFQLEGISLPPITSDHGPQISFWGNVQHKTHLRGSWYIDDVIISDSWNGPTANNGTKTTPPLSPTTSK